MLGALSGDTKVYIVTGRTDMRRSFDGLMALIRDTYQMDPYADALYLFCGRKEIRSRPCTLTRRDLCSARNGWIMESSSGRAMRKKSGCSPASSCAGFWKDSPSASRMQCSLPAGKISDLLCIMMKFKNLFSGGWRRF